MRLRFIEVFVAVVMFATNALAADPFIGAWKINVGKSSSTDPSADRSQIVGMRLIYEAAGADSYRITWQRPNDTRKMLARMDGKNYSNDSDGRDFEADSKLPAGAGMFTIQWQSMNDHHQLLIFKRDGQEYSRRDTSVSQDGKLLTFRQWGLGRTDGKPFDYTLVFDKE